MVNSLAPGKLETLKKCFNQNEHEKEEKKLLSCLSHAIPGKNTKIQLLPVV